ncbi:MAG: 1-acyl-sn-glycerol-3-phosphate acyltransferase [Burkholderiaceae bacterium]|nr:1-acyl-sn-glycerol-3-phosphate acyltransferase [Burkholderiaceae bacterium]MCD8517847.1 1-acyl-sn-glycerol-3-phosphate acyltransferase [Burkholderiaceae bacterium]MCD8535974.1 1-acyl-sn-glycerol-3-phosphate acyltransferase [Burkholderiaceae bacterium]MCD8564614.1 1-acyl-sn-glycerol-3-phosphate acyltransferase [Burkholderiaceae bacterium]
MNVLLFALRAPVVSLWVLCGLATIGLVFPWVGRTGRLALKRQWSRALLMLCGVRAHIEGEPVRTGAVLWAVNHVSWLDIFVLNVVRATAFVAKQEIRHWPVIGWLAAGADTIFIERGYRHAVHRAGQAMQLRFGRHQPVGLFPEGTTSDGFDVLNFYGNLFEPAREPGVAIQPVALRYYHRGERSALPAFVGEESLVQNLWRLLGTTGVSVELVFLPPIGQPDQDKPPRAELARHARESIREIVLLHRNTD